MITRPCWLLAAARLRLARAGRDSRRPRSATPRGTTGNPKGVVYSHRTTFMHSMASRAADTFGISEHDRITAAAAHVPRQHLGPALQWLVQWQ